MSRPRTYFPRSAVDAAFARSDWALLPLVFAALALLAWGAAQMARPYHVGEVLPLTLDPLQLPYYLLRTTLRMAAAMLLSLLFAAVFAVLAAKWRAAERVLIPLLDILQSIPILGFLSITVTGFIALFPGSLFGVECAAIFAIFTSQAWNIAFSLYQSLRTVPSELDDAARVFRLSGWQRFWRLELPFALPGVVWNMMMSMSGGWFFVVAAEAIGVGDTTVTLPGVGSYIALAIERRDLGAVGWAIATMFVVILIYDQLMFRPLVAWADRFRFEQTADQPVPGSWVLTMLRRSRLVALVTAPVGALWRRSQRVPRHARPDTPAPSAASCARRDGFWTACIGVAIVIVVWRVGRFVSTEVSLAEFGTTFLLGLATAARVFVLIAVASLLWVPVGIVIGLRPALARIVQPVAQFLAAFPANLLFPLVVSAIVAFRLDPNIWLSPLMVLGTQWYILFNVVAGASLLPAELRDVGRNLQIRGWLWWRRVALPAVFPFYVTGAITASGGCWNASIVAEIVSWGDEHLHAAGLGAYIAEATNRGDYPRIVLGIALMSAFVVVINRAFWRPLYARAERRFH